MASAGFQGSAGRKFAFILEHIVEHTLQGGAGLTSTNLAADYLAWVKENGSQKGKAEKYDEDSVRNDIRVIRDKLEAYKNGASKALWEISISSGPYRAEFRKPVPMPSKTGATTTKRRRRIWIPILICSLLGLAALFFFKKTVGAEFKILRPVDGAVVGGNTRVEGTGWQPQSYLVVAPQDRSRNKWIQGPIDRSPWAMDASFGDASTPQDMRFDIYVLTSPQPLSTGAVITDLPTGSQTAATITVTRKE